MDRLINTNWSSLVRALRLFPRPSCSAALLAPTTLNLVRAASIHQSAKELAQDPQTWPPPAFTTHDVVAPSNLPSFSSSRTHPIRFKPSSLRSSDAKPLHALQTYLGESERPKALIPRVWSEPARGDAARHRGPASRRSCAGTRLRSHSFQATPRTRRPKRHPIGSPEPCVIPAPHCACVLGAHACGADVDCDAVLVWLHCCFGLLRHGRDAASRLDIPVTLFHV